MSLQSRLAFGFLLLVGLLVAGMTQYASRVYLLDKKESLADRASLLTEHAVSQWILRTERVRDSSFAQARILTSGLSASRLERRMNLKKIAFTPPYDSLVALAIHDPRKQGIPLFTAFNERFYGKLKWDDKDWETAVKDLKLTELNSQKYAIVRRIRPEGGIAVLAFPLRLSEGQPGVLLTLIWSQDIDLPNSAQGEAKLAMVKDQLFLTHSTPALVGQAASLGDINIKEKPRGVIESSQTLTAYAWIDLWSVFVVTQMDLASALTPYRVMVYKIMGVGIIGILAAYILSSIFGSMLLRPLKRILGVARDMADGNYAGRIERPTKDEIGEVARSLNQLGEELGKRTEKLIGDQAQLIDKGRAVALGQFGSGLAHELKNPLTGILGAAHMLHTKRVDFDETKMNEYVHVIEHEAKRCQTIIDSLTQFGARPKVDLVPEDLVKILHETVQLVDRFLAADRITIKMSFPKIHPLLLLHKPYVQLTTLHLILNAKEAMGPGGGTIEMTVREREGKICVALRDTGKGVAPAHLEKVFEPFFTTKKPGEGPGLGLTVSQAMMEDQGGSITVDSRYGQETIVTLLFPMPRESDIKGARALERTRAEQPVQPLHPMVQNMLTRFGDMPPVEKFVAPKTHARRALPIVPPSNPPPHAAMMDGVAPTAPASMPAFKAPPVPSQVPDIRIPSEDPSTTFTPLAPVSYQPPPGDGFVTAQLHGDETETAGALDTPKAGSVRRPRRKGA